MRKKMFVKTLLDISFNRLGTLIYNQPGKLIPAVNVDPSVTLIFISTFADEDDTVMSDIVENDSSGVAVTVSGGEGHPVTDEILIQGRHISHALRCRSGRCSGSVFSKKLEHSDSSKKFFLRIVMALCKREVYSIRYYHMYLYYNIFFYYCQNYVKLCKTNILVDK